MRVWFNRSGEPIAGRLYYVEQDYAFDFVAESDQATPGRDGSGSLVVGTLQLEVDVRSHRILYAWGYCPRQTWRSGAVEPPIAAPAAALVDPSVELDRGVGLGVEGDRAWSIEFDARTGWLRIAPDSAPDDELASIAIGVVLGAVAGRLHSVWLEPEFVQEAVPHGEEASVRRPETTNVRHPLLRKVDAIEIPVPSLELGLAFYRDRLGHELVWRTATSAGLRLAETDAEIVLQAEADGSYVDLLVDSADAAAEAFVAAGGRIVTAPFDIRIGRCAVVEDPCGTRLVLLDMTKGPLAVDADGNVVG